REVTAKLGKGADDMRGDGAIDPFTALQLGVQFLGALIVQLQHPPGAPRTRGGHDPGTHIGADVLRSVSDDIHAGGGTAAREEAQPSRLVGSAELTETADGQEGL